MPAFLVRHEHEADRCPARDAARCAQLLNHLSGTNLRRHGVALRAEAVVAGEHVLYLIVDAPIEVR
jgi:hypothetical protein